MNNWICLNVLTFQFKEEKQLKTCTQVNFLDNCPRLALFKCFLESFFFFFFLMHSYQGECIRDSSCIVLYETISSWLWLRMEVSVVFIKLGRRGSPTHTEVSVASVTTSVFGWFNCRHTWKHITLGDAGTGKFHVIVPVGVGAIWAIMCGQRLIFALIRACPYRHPQGPSLSSVMKETSRHAGWGLRCC